MNSDIGYYNRININDVECLSHIQIDKIKDMKHYVLIKYNNVVYLKPINILNENEKDCYYKQYIKNSNTILTIDMNSKL